MRALVVYESMFGNTETIARSVADGLADRLPVDVVPVGDAPALVGADVTLLVVGGPTHAFGLSRPATRRDAATQSEGGVVSGPSGLREWLSRLDGSRTVPVVTFDTRVARPRLPGSAAHAAQRRLRRMGFPTAAPPTSFWVTGTRGPLVAGEQERARRWGEELGAQVASGQPGPLVS